jgi:hypothetical protein
MIAQRKRAAFSAEVLTVEQFDLKGRRAYHGLFDMMSTTNWRIGIMAFRRGAIALGSLAAFVISITLAAQAPTPPPRKLSKAEEKERDVMYQLASAAATGQMQNDLSLTWTRDDVLKATGNQQYIPFIVTIDPSKAQTKNLMMYWRVVSTSAAPPPAAPTKGNEKGNDKNKPVQQFAYEGLTPATVAADGRISRSIGVLPGTYDVFVVVKEPTPERPPKNAPPPKVSVIKHTLEVPDLWNGELSTSTVFVGRLDPLPAPLTPQQQTERPYAIGTMEITPEPSTKFTKKGELSTFMLIYNPKTDAANKPDIMVEYNFYAKQAGAEKFFNKTNPQNLNAETLPPQFDFAAGHQLQAGQAVPLGSFPEGDYRLEIKVTDKLANKTLTRDVNFSVAGS